MVKLVSFLPAGATRVEDARAGVQTEEERVVDLGVSMRKLLEEGAAGIARAKAASTVGAGVPVSSLKLLAPVPDARQIFCVGANYKDHIEAAGGKAANPDAGDEPLIFNKFTSSLTGAGSPIRLLNNSKHAGMLDYEVEQVAVIGRECSRVPMERAYDYVAGWMVGNDVSERALQIQYNNGGTPGKGGSQFAFGKGFDTAGVCGPFMVTSDEMSPDRANNLNIRCIVNGKVKQDSNTKYHIFKTYYCIAHISQYVTLLPGDLLYMGTCAGTLVETARERKGFKNVDWLKAGDVVVSELEGCGSTTNVVTLDQDVAAAAKL